MLSSYLFYDWQIRPLILPTSKNPTISLTLIYGQTFLSVVHLWLHLPVFYCFYYSNVAAIFQTVLFFFSVSSKMCICPGFPLNTLLTDQSFHNLAQHTIFISGY